MSKVITQIESTGVVLRLQHVIKLSDEQLFELCQINQDLWIERTAEGDLVIMPPEGWETGIYSANFVTLLTQWAWQDGTGASSGLSVQAKMQEYLDNGARLGWLIDPSDRQVYVYRPHQPVERLDNPATVSGDPVLTGFILDLQRIWESGF